MVGMAEVSSIVAGLVAQFLQSRKGTAESVSNAAFRSWLEAEAVPEILARSEQALISIVSLKANQEDRFLQILDRLGDIKRLLVPSTVADTWQSLHDLDRQLLSALFAQAAGGEDAELHIDDVVSSMGATRKLVRSSAGILQERGWIHVHEATSGLYCLTLRPSGLLFTWEATEPKEFAEYRRAVHEQLQAIDDSEQVGVISAQANAPVSLVAALVEAFESDGRLQLRRYDGPSSEHWLVYDVSESLRRALRG